MQFTLKQLETFVWVADLGSFRKAADRLNTTQPNISSRISALESILKVSLMDRDPGSVRLTSKGQELLGHARRVLRVADEFIDASAQSTLVEGTLRLGVTEMIVHTWLGDFLNVLQERFPNITVELTVDLSVNLEQGLADRSIDLALQNGPFSLQTSGQVDLGCYPLVWVAAPGLGLHERPAIRIDDLAAHPVLTHARDTRLYAETAAHFDARRDLAVRLVPSSNLAACLHMTLNNMGIATLPAAMVASDLVSGALVQIAYDWKPESLHFFARYDAERSFGIVEKAAGLAATVATGFIGRFETVKAN